MKVSLINVNLIAEDAIGACMINQARWFNGRGDDVRVYVLHPPHNAPPDVTALTRVVSLADLIGGREAHFRLSDLYIYHYPGRHALMESIRGLDRGAVIFYYHNVTPPDLWGSERDREALIQGLEGTALAHYADLCITPSPFNKRDLVERVGIDPDRVFVLPLAVSLDQFAPGEKDPEMVQRYGLEEQRVLLFVGRMAGNKRIDLLVEALARIQQDVAATKLLLVGDDQGTPAFREVVAAARAQAEAMRIAGDVIWTGRVADLLGYYQLADVFVTASLHEGFGVPLIEAMACAAPVVAARAGAIPWVVGDAGLLCEPGDANDLAQNVLALLRDETLRQSVVERGLERVQAFSLERYETGLAEIVEAVVAQTLPSVRIETGSQETKERQASHVASLDREAMLLRVIADEIGASSDVMLRNYQVRSHIPVIGPLVAWVRRNATSHLREPYLDPTLERQVRLNRELVALLRDLVGRQAALEARIEEGEHTGDE